MVHLRHDLEEFCNVCSIASLSVSSITHGCAVGQPYGLKPGYAGFIDPGTGFSGSGGSRVGDEPSRPARLPKRALRLPAAPLTIATPAPAPAPWPLQDRIAWGANVLLAVLGYAGIMMALSMLKKIERQTKYVETAATAAAESAQAALLQSQFIRHAERPWVLVTVVASPSVENGFTVIATNRGRSPARLVSIANEFRMAVGESKLPGIPEFSPVDPELPPVSIILLPGELTTIKSFSRDEVKAVCGSEEALRAESAAGDVEHAAAEGAGGSWP